MSSQPSQNTFDFIIVGAGTAGCLLANRLSADSHNRVLLIEAGPKDKSPLINVPIGFALLYDHKKLNWRLQSEPEPNLNNRRIKQPRGKVLGGSSAINGMMYVRGQQEDYDHWAELGNDGWSYKEVLPYFLKSEKQLRNSDSIHTDSLHNSAFHSNVGEWPVSDVRFRPELADKFVKAAVESGLNRNPDINGEKQSGIDYTQLSQANGQRYSSARAFLHDALKRPNLRVITEAQVQRIDFDNDRAVGVELFCKGTTKSFQAKKEVILSAGALHSPQLLMLSGVGDQQTLSGHKIKTIKHMPAVGKNLQEHLGINVIYECQKGQSMVEEFKPHRLVGHMVKYLTKKESLLNFNGALVSGFFNTNGDDHERPNCQVVFSPAAADDSDPDNKAKILPGITAMAYPLRPDARGSISLRSASADDSPVIRHGFLETERDKRELIDAVRRIRTIFTQPALQASVQKEIFPGVEQQTDEQILEYIREHALGCYHPAGSCRMGKGDDSVVDERLRVHGLKGLRVVDASIMPTLVSGNTNAPVTMIAEKAATMILEDSA
ncbi:hypothetical protein EOPP23_04585 [Endozoicomonas sp. OPT23]|uniref:GMC family oxidoreductase n=1 Tax=Endozoicomonas sp. OPT23 TaxID=2072845 RepID=UPI00129B6465|nr:GMC family oxidoreductase N-terminal domain-containing protein [Endozoicomonas sp. OPT23]MRI32270.1 hypothetical protein [Endozoicomonas sp. OPT23]